MITCILYYCLHKKANTLCVLLFLRNSLPHQKHKRAEKTQRLREKMRPVFCKNLIGQQKIQPQRPRHKRAEKKRQCPSFPRDWTNGITALFHCKPICIHIFYIIHNYYSIKNSVLNVFESHERVAAQKRRDSETSSDIFFPCHPELVSGSRTEKRHVFRDAGPSPA